MMIMYGDNLYRSYETVTKTYKLNYNETTNHKEVESEEGFNSTYPSLGMRPIKNNIT